MEWRAALTPPHLLQMSGKGDDRPLQGIAFPIPAAVPSPLGATAKGPPEAPHRGFTAPLVFPRWVRNLNDAHPDPRPGRGGWPVARPSKALYLHKPTPGVPPPPTHVLGKAQAVAAHAHRYLELENVSFRPERFATMLYGRPWVLLVMTHDNAPPWEWFNTIGEALKPLKAVYLLGITSLGPEARHMDPSHACANWFKATLHTSPP